jgi:hypothetical protein
MRDDRTSYPEIDDPVVRRMRANFKLASEAEDDNRRRGLDALKFRRGGEYQWDSKILANRELDNRPSETYNQIPQFIHQVTNDMRMNMPQTRFIAGNDGSVEVAEAYEDLARAIQSSSEAETAYDTAADSQVTIGWGYWRYVTDYENDTSFDQIIKIQWIPNTFTVYDDPMATQQDRLDRKWLIQVCDVPRDDFNREYEKDYDSGTLQSIGDDYPNWGSEDTVRIAEYWEVDEKKQKLYRVNDGLTTRITFDKPPGPISDENVREVSVPKVMWYKCTAKEVLDKKEWQGKFIPYICVIGEMLMIDGKNLLMGLVEGMMAPQRQINYWTNAATEAVALAPKPPFIADPEAIGEYQPIWDQLNVRSFPYLPAKSRDSQGNQLATPSRPQGGQDISGMMVMIQQAQQNFYNTTGIYPASLGQASNEKSGKAILARQREGDTSTFHFPDNMARALRAGGRILADLMPKIYDGARILTLTKEDKSTYTMPVNQPFVDEKTNEVREIDMTVGTYDVMVTTGPSFTTRRQEAAETQMQLMQTPLGQVIATVAPGEIVRNQDWPGADKLADKLDRAVPPQFQENGEQQIPPQVQQQLQQAGQMIQELQGQGQQLEAQNAELQQQLQAKDQDMAFQAQMQEMKLYVEQTKAETAQIQAQASVAQAEAQIAKAEAEKVKAEAEVIKAHASVEQTRISAESQAMQAFNQPNGEE